MCMHYDELEQMFDVLLTQISKELAKQAVESQKNLDGDINNWANTLANDVKDAND